MLQSLLSTFEHNSRIYVQTLILIILSFFIYIIALYYLKETFLLVNNPSHL